MPDSFRSGGPEFSGCPSLKRDGEETDNGRRDREQQGSEQHVS